MFGWHYFVSNISDIGVFYNIVLVFFKYFYFSQNCLFFLKLKCLVNLLKKNNCFWGLNERRVYAVIMINLNKEEEERDLWIKLKLLMYLAYLLS